MQTRVVIAKIRWIREQLNKDLEAWMFPQIEQERPGSRDDVITKIHDASRFAELVTRDDAAVQVLRAFDLGVLADRQEFTMWLNDHVSGSSPVRKMRDDASEESTSSEAMSPPPTTTAWQIMIGSVDPIENLTTPEEMRTPELPETFISFELVSIAAETTPLTRLSKATAFAEEAYEAVFRAYKTKGSSTLTDVRHQII